MMIPLAMVGREMEVEIVEFACGNQCACRLQDLGIVKGLRYRVMTGSGSGPVILSNGENRIGLGWGLAAKVYVREIAHA